MLTLEHVSKLLKSKPLLEIQSDLRDVGISMSWNTLNKVRSADKRVLYTTLETLSNFYEGVYDEE